MQLKKYSVKSKLTLLWTPLLAISLTGCGFLQPKPIEKVVTVTKVVPNVLNKTARPKPVTLNDISFKVVTEENYEQFKTEFEKENGALVFYAMTVRDYESMAMNLAELRRYILQQKQVIIYYEKQLDQNNNPQEKKPQDSEENK
jgi:hypothetical protein